MTAEIIADYNKLTGESIKTIAELEQCSTMIYNADYQGYFVRAYSRLCKKANGEKCIFSFYCVEDPIVDEFGDVLTCLPCKYGIIK